MFVPVQKDIKLPICPVFLRTLIGSLAQNFATLGVIPKAQPLLPVFVERPANC
jgi:hypothetical protein